MRFKPFLIAALLFLGAVPGPAPAQDAGWYVGLGAAHMKTDGCPPAPATCDDKDSVWKLFGGYQFNQYLGYELAISDMGKRSATFAGPTLATAQFRFFEMTLTGTLPLGQRLAAYAKAGIFSWDVDFDFPPGAGQSADTNGNDFTFGAGVKYQFTRNFGVRAEWQRYNDVGDPATTGRFNADTYGVGAYFNF